MTFPFIRPTIGRRVWFRPSADYLARNPTMTQLNPEQAMDAGIVYVHHDHMVNLQVADHVGRQFMVPSVPLLAGAWEASDGLDFAAEWMPFQKGQAAKSEVSEKAISHPVCTQRDQLEYALVSGAATSIAQEPRRAQEIADGVQKVLNTLRPTPPAAQNQTATGHLVLPVVDPGPDSLEREIQAKASKAPRVTPADIQASILREHYFTAADGAFGASMRSDGTAVPPADGAPMGLLTFCVLELCNGFTVTGESACASPENFNVEIGRRIARENAVTKLWPLLGFRLRDKLTAR